MTSNILDINRQGGVTDPEMTPRVLQVGMGRRHFKLAVWFLILSSLQRQTPPLLHAQLHLRRYANVVVQLIGKPNFQRRTVLLFPQQLCFCHKRQKMSIGWGWSGAQGSIDNSKSSIARREYELEV